MYGCCRIKCVTLLLGCIHSTYFTPQYSCETRHTVRWFHPIFYPEFLIMVKPQIVLTKFVSLQNWSVDKYGDFKQNLMKLVGQRMHFLKTWNLWRFREMKLVTSHKLPVFICWWQCCWDWMLHLRVRILGRRVGGWSLPGVQCLRGEPCCIYSI